MIELDLLKGSEEKMEEYLQTSIKVVISRFPRVGEILEAYHIDCVACTAGSCLLKDIVEIHNLPEEEEQKMMVEIARVISPDKAVASPRSERKVKTRTAGIKYSPPMKRLVDEHALIKRWIGLIPKVLERFDVESGEDRRLILDGVNFIRSYADRFHHAKEEEILFKYFDEGFDVIKTMLEDHGNARAHVKAIVEAVERKDRNEIEKHLNAYRELLMEHIRREDEILYPWMDRNLSVRQVGELFTKFREADDVSDREGIKRCERFVVEVESKFGKEVPT